MKTAHTRCSQTIQLALLLGSLSNFASGASMNQLQNGGFESPPEVSGYLLIPSGAQPAGFNWTVQQGSVELARQGYTSGNKTFDGPPFEGLQILDLDGIAPGTIYQDFATIPGSVYALSFAYANNPFLQFTGPARAQVTLNDVAANIDLVSPFEINHEDSTTTNYHWDVSGPILFLAAGSSTRLKFTSLNQETSMSGIFLDAVRVEGDTGSSLAYCFGDGSGTQCPCSNNGSTGQGCQHSGGQGATLSSIGDPSLANDTLLLVVVGAPAGKPGLILQGSTRTNGGLGNIVGGGLLCASGQTTRSHVQTTSATGATTFADLHGQPLGTVSFGIGQPTNYQFWFRDATGTCKNFNFTNGLQVTWGS